MAAQTGIEWTDSTWNVIRGCTRVSEGCVNCYAEIMAARFSQPGQWGHGFAEMKGGDHRWTGKVELIESQLGLPLRWKKPRKIFVNSTSDLFHEALSFGAIMRVFNVMWRAPHHTFQILTKRPARMREFMLKWADLTGEDFEPKLVHGPAETRAAHQSGRGQLFADMLEAMGKPPSGCAYPTFDWMDGMIRWPSWPANVWLGTSVEDQERADERIPLLLETPAAVRFLSVEPLLGPVHINRAFMPRVGHRLNPSPLHWVIVGGESGPGARPMNPDWARHIREQCADADVPFFFKQWGEWGPFARIDLDWFAERKAGGHFANRPDLSDAVGWPMQRAGKSKTGRTLDGVEWNEFPRMPQGPALGGPELSPKMESTVAKR